VKRSISIFLIILFCLIPLVVPASGQQTARPLPGVQEDSVIKIRTELITVLVSVTDQRGNLINTLTKDDFEVLENGVPQEVSTFGRENTLPLQLTLLFDTSSSVKPRLKFEQQAAAKFFKDVLRPVDKAALYGFNHDVTVEQDFTSDINALSSAARNLKAKGGTALFDALYIAAQRLEKTPAGRRVIVVISDGANTISRTTQEIALRMVEKADAVIYGIYTATRLDEDLGPGYVRGDLELQKICERTGGEVYFPKDISSLDEIFIQLGSVLRSQYALGYYSKSDDRDGTYRTLKVNLKNTDLKIRTRKGYYASKD
jgi:Ca-activated chloride channel homolog